MRDAAVAQHFRFCATSHHPSRPSGPNSPSPQLDGLRKRYTWAVAAAFEAKAEALRVKRQRVLDFIQQTEEQMRAEGQSDGSTQEQEAEIQGLIREATQETEELRRRAAPCARRAAGGLLAAAFCLLTRVGLRHPSVSRAARPLPLLSSQPAQGGERGPQAGEAGEAGG